MILCAFVLLSFQYLTPHLGTHRPLWFDMSPTRFAKTLVYLNSFAIPSRQNLLGRHRLVSISQGVL